MHKSHFTVNKPKLYYKYKIKNIFIKVKRQTTLEAEALEQQGDTSVTLSENLVFQRAHDPKMLGITDLIHHVGT